MTNASRTIMISRTIHESVKTARRNMTILIVLWVSECPTRKITNDEAQVTAV